MIIYFYHSKETVFTIQQLEVINVHGLVITIEWCYQPD